MPSSPLLPKLTLTIPQGPATPSPSRPIPFSPSPQNLSKFGISIPSEPVTPPKTPSRPAKKPKLRSLPPPGECFQPSPEPSPRRRILKPRTTTEKIRAADQMKRKKEKREKKHEEQKIKEEEAKDSAVKGKEDGYTGKGMFEFLAGQQTSSISFSPGSKKFRDSVLVRPTRRAERDRKEEATSRAMNIDLAECSDTGGGGRSGGINKDPFSDNDGGGQSRLLQLPDKIRKSIWKEAVASSRFIWAAERNGIGAEQPDLAMVCRSIREEVLPLYYGLNTFAVDISPSLNGPNNLSDAKQWSSALEKEGRANMIRSWALSFVAPGGVREEEKCFIVSIQFPGIKDAESRRPKTATVPRIPEIEVHSDAQCLLTTSLGFCKVRSTPSWIGDVVTDVLKAGRRKGFEARRVTSNAAVEMVMKIAEKVRERAGELVESRCLKIRQDDEDCFGKYSGRCM